MLYLWKKSRDKFSLHLMRITFAGTIWSMINYLLYSMNTPLKLRLINDRLFHLGLLVGFAIVFILYIKRYWIKGGKAKN